LVGENEKLGENIELLELLKGAFSPNGLKAMMVDFIIPQLEDKINEILGKLSDFRVHLDTQKSSVGGDSTIEGLFINVINDMGESLDFNSFSGGECTKIIISINESLGSLQKFGFRVWDESITGLDENMIYSFSDVILKLKENINQILMISHLPAIQEIFEEKITVTKINGNSIISTP